MAPILPAAPLNMPRWWDRFSLVAMAILIASSASLSELQKYVSVMKVVIHINWKKLLPSNVFMLFEIHFSSSI